MHVSRSPAKSNHLSRYPGILKITFMSTFVKQASGSHETKSYSFLESLASYELNESISIMLVYVFVLLSTFIYFCWDYFICQKSKAISDKIQNIFFRTLGFLLTTNGTTASLGRHFPP